MCIRDRPQKTAALKFAIRGQGVETVRLTVFDPASQPAGTVQTTPQQESAELTVAPGANAGKVWSLSLTKGDEGVLEDGFIKLGAEFPPLLSLRPEDVFRTNP